MAAPKDPREQPLNQRSITRLRHCPRDLPRRTTAAYRLSTEPHPTTCIQADCLSADALPVGQLEASHGQLGPRPRRPGPTALVGNNRRPRALTTSPARDSLPLAAEGDNQCPENLPGWFPAEAARSADGEAHANEWKRDAMAERVIARDKPDHPGSCLCVCSVAWLGRTGDAQRAIQHKALRRNGWQAPAGSPTSPSSTIHTVTAS